MTVVRIAGCEPMEGTKQQLAVHVRWMIRRDMPEVLDIESEAFPNPWTEEDFIAALRQRNCIGMVAEHGQRVAGYMIYELHAKKLHVLDFAVRNNCRGKGVGRQMVNKLKSKLSCDRRSRIMLEIRDTNLDAQLFFRALGFRAVNVLHDFYCDATDDAYLFCYRHGATP